MAARDRRLPRDATGPSHRLPQSHAQARALSRGADDPALQLNQEAVMSDDVTVRRVGADEAAACVEGLADVLIDCVEGGASVSFMLPLPRDKAVRFWRTVADGVARHERVLLVAEDRQRQIVGTVQLVMA